MTRNKLVLDCVEEYDIIIATISFYGQHKLEVTGFEESGTVFPFCQKGTNRFGTELELLSVLLIIVILAL